MNTDPGADSCSPARLPSEGSAKEGERRDGPRHSVPALPRRATREEPAPVPGRGAAINPPNRFEKLHLEADPDCPPEERPHPRTQFYFDSTESLLTKNESPDVGFMFGL